jgi:hypothetical protein
MLWCYSASWFWSISRKGNAPNVDNFGLRGAGEVHRVFDVQIECGFIQFLRRYTADELRLLVRVLREAADASFLSLGSQAASDE